jgi:flagellar biosynthetic protein FlhB
MVLIDQPETLAPLFLSDGGHTLGGDLIARVGLAMLPWFALPACFAVASAIAQQAFTVTPSKLQPKLNRISPVANLKNKLGRNGLFEFAKSFAKLLIVSGALGIFLASQIGNMLATARLEAGPVVALMADTTVSFMFVVLCVSFAIGLTDYLWQRAEHMHRHRMSHKELMDEQKQTEGDPHLKQKRRQKGHDLATNRMMQDVPTADVVVVNPEHVAVALKWSRSRGSAPACVAKGVDEVAARIREAASLAGVPIHRDPPTARALHATVQLGEEIRPDHYQAVASAIRFADRMRTRRRAGAWR